MDSLMDNNELKHRITDYIDYNLEIVSKPFIAFFKESYGLTLNQMSLIWYLRRAQIMSMSRCAEKLYMTKQQATQLVDTLVKKNLVERSYPKENRRSIEIFLTEKGLEIITDIEDRYTDKFIKQSKKLNSEEIKEFLTAMEIINNVLPKLDSVGK